MSASNLLFICTDQHTRRASGCYGHPVIQTPNLDKLAVQGTRFTRAYASSPICMPARASMATGLHVHQHRFWSSAEMYDGSIPSWGHRVMEAGGASVSIGKLHYRSEDDPNGFDTEILTMHSPTPEGWAQAILRGRTPPLGSNAGFAQIIGWGDTDYTAYDRRVADAATAWLREQPGKLNDRPWALFISFVSPHNPFKAPEEFRDLYPDDRIAMPTAYGEGRPPRHPVEHVIERCFASDDYFENNAQVRLARAGYYGLCTFVDLQIGRVLAALEDSGAADRTSVLYLSDHGEMLGHGGFWGKYIMREDSVAIPMILRGPTVPRGRSVDTCASHVDVMPTVVEALGLPRRGEDATLPGRSLFELARGASPSRVVLSEYHDGGSPTGLFMLRCGKWKYVYFTGYAPQLFDAGNDPGDLVDLGESPEHAAVRAACEAKLREMVDPEAANKQALADQSSRLEELGGADALLARNTVYDTCSYTPPPA